MGFEAHGKKFDEEWKALKKKVKELEEKVKRYHPS